MSPLQRTQKLLRERGYYVAKTEHWNHYAKIRQDLFGFIDTLAVNGNALLAVQTTTGSHCAATVKKVMSLPVARVLVYHMEIEVWSWEKQLSGDKLKSGKLDRRKVWTLRVEKLTARLLPEKSLLRRKLEEGTWDL
jgi:hypothetical protein